MFELNSDRVKLLALSAGQLQMLLNQPQALEQALGCVLAEQILDENARRAIEMKLKKMAQLKDNQTSSLLWITYWLIIPDQEKIGVGLIGFKGAPDKAGYVEVGYGIAPQFRQRGLASSALSLLTDWAFSFPACLCITAIEVTNLHSQHLLARAGYFELAEESDGRNWYRFRPLETSIREPIFTAIGILYSPHLQAAGTPIQAAATDAEGTIVLQPQFAPALIDLQGFSHLILLYLFDRAQPARMQVKPFLDDAQRGVFATRAPSRPNPIGFSVVQLIGIDHNLVRVAKIDLLNGTPILDIKPFIPQFDCPQGQVRIGWLEKHLGQLNGTYDDGRFLIGEDN